MKRSTRSPKAGRGKPATPKPRVKVAVRRGTMLLESDLRRPMEHRMAPPRYTERRHARPGAGIKRSRANMSTRSR